jgi:hypothetical protein
VTRVLGASRHVGVTWPLGLGGKTRSRGSSSGKGALCRHCSLVSLVGSVAVSHLSLRVSGDLRLQQREKKYGVASHAVGITWPGGNSGTARLRGDP